MPYWTPDNSMILSLLLDVVVGTKEEIDIRHDYCRVHEYLKSVITQQPCYFTGSKSEGLNLPGSDMDYMIDVNNYDHIKVIQSVDENPDISPDNVSVFLLCTENVPPGFAFLIHLDNVHQTMRFEFLNRMCQNINGAQFFSNDLFYNNHEFKNINPSIGKHFVAKQKRQGPSREIWTRYCDISASGTDFVFSIHCEFWPNEAMEWITRPREFDWPTCLDRSSIIKFGFHLVPVGHPHSDMKHLQWRMSFSLAERTLVWSFNHVQMQCYAIMKMILKEFIKAKCSSQNQVLCSYFIKTFLFWKYESTELNFWRADNLRECVRFLLFEFSQCLREGVLRHYFISTFNLFSVKLKRAAQIELLQLFDIIIEKDISIIKECITLHNIWSVFSQTHRNRSNIICNVQRRKMLNIDKCMMQISVMLDLQLLYFQCSPLSLSKAIRYLLAMFFKTSLKIIVIRKCLYMLHRSTLRTRLGSGNQTIYQLKQIATYDAHSVDMSTCKLWSAILLYMKGEFLLTLDIVNKVLSNIPSFAMFESRESNKRETLYIDRLMDSGTTITQRVRKYWLPDMRFTNDIPDPLPLGIQIELYFSYLILRLSPTVCACYLKFMCYHKMNQFDRREFALQQLIQEMTNPEQPVIGIYDANIVGHCLLLAGKIDTARVLFFGSYIATHKHPFFHKHNSALWYLRNCC